ncbi:DsbA family protein [Streptosporangium subroseum]|uniref:DsbA family protein n=1 Tax=Streptosporangium subroseum TaxID=106412 RepID=UPI00117DF936|nr:thioredoxin domain-containing protein [Streptosporangium subroseum]
MSLLDVPSKPRRTRRFVAVIMALGLFGALVAYSSLVDVQDATGISSARSSLAELVTVRPDGSVMIAQPGVERPLLEVYEDYQCPVCQEFERGNGKAAREAALRGEFALLIHPMTIFQDSPMHENSHRALTAALCVTDPEQWLAYHDALYAAQPSEAQDGGFAVRDLMVLAEKAGVHQADFAACISSKETSDKAEQLSMTALAQGVQGTPTVRYNGQDIDWSTPWAAPSATTV